MPEPEKKQALGPRFKIQKMRIGSDNEKISENVDFSPEKIIYVEIDEEITMVFDRIKRNRGKKIALVIPKRSTILQSVVNLKILKRKTDELEKEIVIVTADIPGLQLAEKAGIPAAQKLIEKDTAEPLLPLPAVRGERPVKMLEKKVSISDVIRHGEKADFVTSFISRLKDRLKKRKLAGKETRIVFVTPNKQALFTLILVSVFLMLAIAYIALPGATVYITPKTSVLDPSFNVTFLDFDKNRNILEDNNLNNIIIASYPVKPPAFTKKYSHPATGKLFRGTNSRGIITVINLSSAPWDLAAKTRFQTDDGLVFRTPIPVRVPAAKINGEPGRLDVNVVADEFDASGQVIGSRGNIPPARFFLPGLKTEESRKKLYGESKNPMTDGTTDITKMASKQDTEAANEFVKREIAKDAIDDLKKYLEEQNLIKKTNLSLLTDRHVIRMGEPIISIPENIIGKAVDQFEVQTTYTAQGVAFDRLELTGKLKERLMNRVDPDKKIVKVEEDDVSYKFLDEDQTAGKIRLTATMRAIQMYELDPEKENGHRFIKKVTDHILGMSVKDAISYMQQQTDEISRVEITTWPVWAPTIPNIADNIRFVMKEDEGT